MAFELRALRRGDDRGGFDCGIEPLNVFFRRYAHNHQFKYGISVTWVAADEERVAGFVTVTVTTPVETDVAEEFRAAGRLVTTHALTQSVSNPEEWHTHHAYRHIESCVSPDEGHPHLAVRADDPWFADARSKTHHGVDAPGTSANADLASGTEESHRGVIGHAGFDTQGPTLARAPAVPPERSQLPAR